MQMRDTQVTAVLVGMILAAIIGSLYGYMAATHHAQVRGLALGTVTATEGTCTVTGDATLRVQDGSLVLTVTEEYGTVTATSTLRGWQRIERVVGE